MRNLQVIVASAAILAAAPAAAASLQVTPVLVDVTAEASAATTMTLRNTSNKPAAAQLRVFRWSQANGEDQFEETTDVAVSPPMVSMKPNADYVIRIVRTSRTPIRGEESYRVVADELPEASSKNSGTVNLLVRHSVPVFFHSTSATPAAIHWEISRSNGRIVLRGKNDGDRRMRIARLKATDASGSTVNYGDGLVGYVLGNSANQFASRSPAKGFAGGSAKLSLNSEDGLIAATAAIR